MSVKGNQSAENLIKFMNILGRYDVAAVYGHYLNVVVELEPNQFVSQSDTTALNSINAFNDLKTNIWQLYY